MLMPRLTVKAVSVSWGSGKGVPPVRIAVVHVSLDCTAE